MRGWAAMLALLISTTAHSAVDIVSVANSVRQQGCGGRRGVREGLIKDSRLIDAAKLMAKGASLQSAMDSSSYRAMRSASLYIQGSGDADALARMLGGGFCERIVDPDFHEVGVFTKGEDTWLVLATPLEQRNPGKMPQVAQRVLQLTNEARAHQRKCGSKEFPPAPPLKLQSALTQAALVHSKDMASHQEMRHEGDDHSTPADRVAAQGYKWRVVGENVAVGPVTAEEVVNGWLNSPGHCVNIMHAGFTEMGLAYVLGGKSPARVYWTQAFATPRK